MADYRIQDARFTMILLKKPRAGGGETVERVPFDLVRFNVDVDPDAPEFIMPVGEPHFPTGGTKRDADKQFERIWFVDGPAPFSAKTRFGNIGL